MNYQDKPWFGMRHVLKEVTNSTNDDIKELAGNGTPGGYVVRAMSQTNGKGRRGREWVSKDGGLYFSFDLSPSLMEAAGKPLLTSMQAPVITLLAAMSVCETIREKTGLEAMIKWPNDIVIDGKKVCGILTEMMMKENQIDLIIVGIGINLLQEQFPEDIANTATSLRKECVTKGVADLPDANQLVNAVIENMHYFYDVYFMQSKENFRRCYNECLAGMNNAVRVLDPKGEYSGISLGINASGELLVQKEDGEIDAVYAGEVSVRGIYGYV